MQIWHEIKLFQIFQFAFKAETCPLKLYPGVAELDMGLDVYKGTAEPLNPGLG